MLAHQPTKKQHRTESINPAMLPRLVCDFYIPRKLGDFKASQPKVGGTCWDQPDQATGGPGGLDVLKLLLLLLLKPDAKNMGGFVSKSWKFHQQSKVLRDRSR